jgi:hypothetical protein
MLDLVRKHKIQVEDHGQRSSESGEYSVDTIAEPAQIQQLRDAGYRVEQHEDVDKRGKERQKEVGRGDRYKDKGPEQEKGPDQDKGPAKDKGPA